jgi:branched-subunit amino acid transport protein
VIWAAVLLAAAGCYGFKLAGLSIPEHVLSTPIVQRIAAWLPVALLAALVGVQTFSSGQEVLIDARVAGVAAAVVALLLRAPFLVVVGVAAVVAAGLRALG